ncbi:MAG: hypothetical protein A2017_04745 [Lentisphaerae bacterium GWF2_44_16]|nr:MAG: hypothetical protein A2017_04745 [Lentisphaerae bacterium GWF2_44_16]
MKKLFSIEQQKTAVKLKEEKLKSIRQVMRIAHHHVSNLANNLSLVEVEIECDGAVSTETLKALDAAIKETAETMKLPGDIENPYNDEMFEI